MRFARRPDPGNILKGNGSRFFSSESEELHTPATPAPSRIFQETRGILRSRPRRRGSRLSQWQCGVHQGSLAVTRDVPPEPKASRRTPSER